MRTEESIQQAYDAQYTEGLTEWRELGGRYKAENILDVCAGKTFGRVLECGAGEGSILRHLEEANAFGELYAVEISSTGIDRIQQRNLRTLREVRKFDGYEIPYPDKFFDMAYCSHVLEHVEHPRLLLRELKRVSAFQVFEVPLDYHLGVDREVKHFLSYGHINIFLPSTFRFLLKSEGYEIHRERLTRPAKEVLRFNWKQNPNSRPKLAEVRLALRGLTLNFRRLVMGAERYAETTYSAYTCLAQGKGQLRIL